MATKSALKIGWIGMGRMGYPMAERLLKAGHDVTIWNRTRSKAEPLTKLGGKVVDHLHELKSVDILFSIVATGADVEEVLYGKNGVCSQGGKIPPVIVDCSTIAVEESKNIRLKLKDLGAGAIPDRDVVARLEQAFSHGKAHAAHADPADLQRVFRSHP